MPFTIYKNTADPLPLLVGQLRLGRLQDHLVLVSTTHDKRLIQTTLSEQLSGLTPKVEVLSHQLATWLKYGVEHVVDKIFLTPRERRFALDKWNAAFGLGFSDMELDRFHDILSWVGLHGVDPEKLPGSFGELEKVFSRFASWCADQGWVDRTLLYLNAYRVPSHAIDPSHIHLYHIGKPDRYITVAIDAILAGGGSDKIWSIYRPSGETHSCGLKVDQPSADEVDPRHVRVQVMHALHKRGEVANAFKIIKSLVADTSEGLAFDDFVILATDYDHYRPIIEQMSGSFEVAVSLASGTKILGDPAVSRLRTMLNLGINGFQLDDIQDVYGDGIVPLSSVHTDEKQLPNLRTFARFCKQYNIRTIGQLEGELARAIDREERNRIQAARRRGSTLDGDPTMFKERHSGFYRDICDSLVALKDRFPGAALPLSAWLTWVKDMMTSLGVLTSAELMTAIGRFSKAAELGLSMTVRIGHDPVVDGRAFSIFFDALLDGNLPITHHPGRVMVGAFDDYTCMPGKRVIVLGMTESGFPKSFGSEDLFSFMGPDGASWVRSLENDPYDMAASALASIATQARSLCLSYAKSGDSDHSMPSVFITDTTMFLPWIVMEDVAPPDGNRCFDSMDWMDHNARIPWDPEINAISSADLGQLSRHVAGVARLRASPGRITVWEGMLPSVNKDLYGVAESVIQEAVSGLMKDGSLRISVSQLDAFAASPLEYFFRWLLRIEPPTEYVDEAEQNKKGTLLHTILDLFYSDADGFGDIVNPVTDEDSARRRINEIAARVFEDHVEDLGNPDTPFPRLLKSQIEATLDAFIDAEHIGLHQVTGIWGEVRPATIFDSSKNVTEVPFLYELHVDGVVVEINGFIDRIDSNADESMKIIYDYKSGGASSIKQFKEMNSGMSFQLPVYLNSLKGVDGSRVLAGYYHIPLSKKGKDIRLKGMLGNRSLTMVKDHELRFNDNHGLLPDGELARFLKLLQERRIKPIVRLILSGRFHQSMTEPSTYSDFKRMSRWSKAVNELRKLTITPEYGEGDIFTNYYVESTVYVGTLAAESADGED